MAWVEKRGNRFRIAFRIDRQKKYVNLNSDEPRDAEICLNRLEDNLRLVERGRLSVPSGVDIGRFLLSDGKLEARVEIVAVPTLKMMLTTYQERFTEGAKEKITRRMEDVHIRHLLRHLGARTLVSEITPGIMQQFVDTRSRQKHKGYPIKSTTIRKSVATLRVIWNWSYRQGQVATKFPSVDLVYAKERQAEPFRTFDQIEAIVARGGVDKRRVRELWDGLFLDPRQIEEVLESVRIKTQAKWLYPFLVTTAYTGARRSELFRSRIEDFDFEGKTIMLREKKRRKEKETFRTVEMTPFVERVMTEYFQQIHPGGEWSFCTQVNYPVTDGKAWRAFRTSLSRSRWSIIRGFHTFRHSFASNLAAAGIDSRVINELMGHQTAEMEARYRHLFPDQRRTAVMSVFDRTIVK